MPFHLLLFWQRKLEREYVLYGGAPPNPDAESNENDEVKEAEGKEEEEVEEEEHLTSVSGKCTYCVCE